MGIKEIRESLLRIFQSEKIPQAFLFTGTRGIGKTSAARIIAKAANCLNRGKDPEPCNRCEACLSVQKGNAVDLIEIDAASNRGIDDIRQLKEKVDLMPVKLAHKVYIIDEVHMLTTEAFNALLKTLEEPPLHTIFILCTTNPEKIPATITSRCLRFDFRQATEAEVVENLTAVAKKEALKVEPAVFDLLAKVADGSFRDGQKALQQLSSGRKEISLSQAREFFGSFDQLGFDQLIGGLVEKDIAQTFAALDKLSLVKPDYDRLLKELMEVFRQAILIKLGVGGEKNSSKLALKAADLKLADLRELINLFLTASVQLKTSPIASLPLELALASWLGQEEPPLAKTGGGDSLPPRRSPDQESKKKNHASNKTVVKDFDNQCWQKILSTVRPQNHSIEALLRSCRPVGCDNQHLILEVFYKFHKEQLEIHARREIIEKTASQVLGRPVRLKLVLGTRPVVVNQETEQTEDSGTEKSGTNDDLDVIISQASKIFS